MRRTRPSPLALLLWVGLPPAAVALLLWMGRIEGMAVDWSDPLAWLRSVPVEDALTAGLRAVVLAVALWLTAVHLLYLAAHLLRLRRLLDLTRLLMLPGMRRMADRVVAGMLVATTVAGPATATEQVDPSYVPVPAGWETPLTTTTTTVSVTTQPAEAPLPAPPPDPADPSPPHPEPGSSGLAAVEVVVQPGDNMWRLAQRRLAEAGEPTDDRRVAPYWVRVVEANRHRIRSGNPDLIFPGEVLVLPPLEEDVSRGGS